MTTTDPYRVTPTQYAEAEAAVAAHEAEQASLPSKLTDAHKAAAPATLADCPEHGRYGAQVMHVTTEKLPFQLWADVAAMAIKAEKAGLVVKRETYGVHVHLPLDAEGAAAAIATAAADWDVAADEYDQAVVDKAVPAGWSAQVRVREYCEKRGLDLPWASA